MKNLIEKILQLLETHFAELRQEKEAARIANNKDIWLDAYTTRMMLRVSERTLFNYVKQAKLVSIKRGQMNYFLEASVLAFMNRNYSGKP